MRRSTVTAAVETNRDYHASRRIAALPSTPIRGVIADGQALVRAGVRLLLEADERITVVGEADTGEETLALAEQTRPDVVMGDTHLPGLDSVETTRRMVSESGVAVMLLTAGES